MLFVCTDIVHKLGVLLYPFTPSASQSILDVFSEEKASIDNIASVVRSGIRLNLEELHPLFSKLTEEQLAEIERHGGEKNLEP